MLVMVGNRQSRCLDTGQSEKNNKACGPPRHIHTFDNVHRRLNF